MANKDFNCWVSRGHQGDAAYTDAGLGGSSNHPYTVATLIGRVQIAGWDKVAALAKLESELELALTEVRELKELARRGLDD